MQLRQLGAVLGMVSISTVDLSVRRRILNSENPMQLDWLPMPIADSACNLHDNQYATYVLLIEKVKNVQNGSGTVWLYKAKQANF